MGMRAAVSAALNKGSVLSTGHLTVVLFIIDTTPCEGSYLFWQSAWGRLTAQAAIIGHFYSLDIFIAGINHRVFAGNPIGFFSFPPCVGSFSCAKSQNALPNKYSPNSSPGYHSCILARITR